MPIDSYFQLLNPMVFGAFAVGLLFLYSTKSEKATLIFAASYTFGAAAFVFDLLYQNNTDPLLRTVIAGLYAVTAALVSSGLWIYYKQKAPWRLLTVVTVTHLAIYLSLYLAQYSWARSLEANFGCGVIFLIGMFAFRGRLRRTTDKLLFGLHSISCLQCFIRPTILAIISSGPLTNASHSESLFILSMHFFVGISAVSMGMLLMVMLSRDLFEELQRKSVTDILSGILNRRGFETEINTHALHENNAIISLILLDIDNFKNINDTYGHAAGDDVITALGGLLSRYTYVNDTGHKAFVGRLGGEEFAVALPGASLVDACEEAEKLRVQFETLQFPIGSSVIQCTSSFGVTEIIPSETISDAFARADKALYLAKDAGRNCIRSDTDLAIEELKRLEPSTNDASFILDIPQNQTLKA